MTKPKTALRVEDLTWTEFERRAPATPYWIIVTGSVEQHGPHLPLGADTLVVERAAELLAQRHGALMLSTIRTGVLHAFREWPGSTCLTTETFTAMVTELATGILPYRNRLMLLNGHDENHESLMTAARRLVDQHGTDVVVVEWAELVRDVIRRVSASSSEAHAGEGLTSLFLHWYPDRVRTGQIRSGTPAARGLAQDDLHVGKFAHRPIRFARNDIPTGVIGDPRPASPGKGAEIANALVDRLELLVKERQWL